MTTKSSNLFIKQGNNTKRFVPIAASRSAGFTIVELLIVVIVIAILATLTIVGFNNINARATESALKSELQSAAKLVEIDLINSGSYPADASAANGGKGLVAGGKRVLSYSRTGTGYCASIHPEGNPDLTFRIRSGAGQIEPGVCEPVEMMVSTLAGSTEGFADGTGSAAQFSYPRGVAIDTSGTVYVADSGSHLIRKISPAGVVSTLAGSGTRGFANGTGTAAQFRDPFGVAVDASGMVYVADSSNHRIRKITPAGVVSTLAGSGTSGFANGTGTAAQFANPFAVAVDTSGMVYVADTNNHRIRKITPAGVVSTLAGSGTSGFANGTGSAAEFAGPSGIAIDASGTVYVADSWSHRIRTITPAGVVSTLAGSGTAGFANGTGAAAQFADPGGVAVDASGTVYVADSSNNRIRTITPAGVVSTLAGSGTYGVFADGTGTAARFYYPTGVAIDASGTVYVADSRHHRIRTVSPAD